MADEETGAPPADDVVAPADGGTETIENQQPDPVADLARKIGWKPKEEFAGDPELWKPADEFIVASRDVQKGLSRELKTVREEVSRIGRTSAEMSEQIKARAIAERDSYWRGIHKQAVEDGNVELAERAVDERTKLKAAAPQPSNDPPAETRDFTEKHKAWFGVDPLATSRAKALADALAKDGYDIPTQLREVERAIKKEFPEHFPAPAKTPAGVQTAGSRSTDTGSRQKGFADMPEASRQMALDYEKRHGIKKDDFARSYWADEAKKQRRSA